MARRAKAKTLVPDNLRKALNTELVANGFSNYQVLTDWLNEQLRAEGLDVTLSVMAVNRYGRDFQKQFEAEMSETRQTEYLAKSLLAQGDDVEGAVREAAVKLLQSRLLRLTSALREAQEAGDDVHKIAETTSKITRALADLGRLDIASQKYKQALEESVFQARLDVIRHLREFIKKLFPNYQPVFLEVLPPFAEHLAKIGLAKPALPSPILEGEYIPKGSR